MHVMCYILLVCHVRNVIMYSMVISCVTLCLVCHVRNEIIRTLLMSCVTVCLVCQNEKGEQA
jgi:hypothetical protein